MIQIPLWLYMAVMAAGSAAQYKGAEKADKERAKAMAEERRRRGKLTAENEASAEKSKNLFANVRKDEETKAAQTAQSIAAAPTQVADPGAGRILDPNSPTASTSTVEGAKTALAGVDSQLAKEAQARAAAGAFGGVMGDYGRSIFGNAQDIDMNSASMRNWNQNVLPAQLEYANQSGREWNTAGDVLKLAGTIMAPFALGGGAPASETTEGVLDQMSGMPKEFAGKDLFGMGDKMSGSFWTHGAGAGDRAGFLGSIVADPRADARMREELLAGLNPLNQWPYSLFRRKRPGGFGPTSPDFGMMH